MFKLLILLAVSVVGMVADCGEYGPSQWNLAARKRFAEHRFGIFIHWGLYSYYAQGEWYLRLGNVEKYNAPLNEKAYSRMMHGFYPSKFNAKAWVRAFRNAGARYVTITSRHHDGFSMWPTKVDDGYNISKTPFGRDVLKELATACEEEGLQLNLYYSLMDWHRKDYPVGECAEKVLGKQKGDYVSYKSFMMKQITELIDNYHPGCIWFDGEWEHMRKLPDGRRLTHEQDPALMDWEFDDIYDLIHSKKTLVANNNHAAVIREKEDIQLFERDLPGHGTSFSAGQGIAAGRPLEQCDVLQESVWGYKISETSYRSPEAVVKMIVKAAAKGSNLLMNIGPDASGQLPEKAVSVLADVGKWMRANGHAIYGTQGGGFSKDGNVAYTMSDKVVYEISLPSEGYGFPVVTERTGEGVDCVKGLTR